MIHEFRMRIYFQDTDAGGIAYHANYLTYAERARSDFLLQNGYSNSDLIKKGVSFVIRHAELDYKLPARLDDEIMIKTQIEEVRSASMIASQSVWRGDSLLTKIRVHAAVVDIKTLSPMRMPTDLKNMFNKYLIQKGEANES